MIFSDLLLNWYDTNAREMPWRISPSDRIAGVTPDPYHVWLSEIMLQQTTVATVKSYFIKFISRWPTLEKLAQADEGEVTGAWAGLGYYARARNLLKCAKIVCDLSILIILMPSLVKVMFVSNNMSFNAVINVRNGAICTV